jgi:peptidyl-prolyl cis-trans isomerase SurA
VFYISNSALSETVERVSAIVNNEVVTESELKAFSKRIEKTQFFIDEILLLGKSSADLIKNKEDQLNYVINEKLMDSEVKRLNLSVTSERVEQEIRELAKRNGVTRNDLIGAIKQQGISVSEYQGFIKSKIERQSLIEAEITSKIRVNDEDVLAAYSQNNPNSTSGIYEYSISHIYFNPKKGGFEEAHSRAELVVRKLKAGETFEVLAEQHSEDTNFTNGGFLGSFKAGEFAKEMEVAVSQISPGQTTGVVKSKSGLHVLKLLSKKIVADPKFEGEKEKIRSFLFDRAFQKHFKNWLQSKRDEAFIKINK